MAISTWENVCGGPVTAARTDVNNIFIQTDVSGMGGTRVLTYGGPHTWGAYILYKEECILHM